MVPIRAADPSVQSLSEEPPPRTSLLPMTGSFESPQVSERCAKYHNSRKYDQRDWWTRAPKPVPNEVVRQSRNCRGCQGLQEMTKTLISRTRD